MSLQASSTGPDREIAALGPWFHNLHLPDGRQTAPGHPLGDFPAFKWRALAPALGADLGGVRALDIGCNAGYYAFALAARGATVLGLDSDEHYLRQARWAARWLDPERRVSFVAGEVYELAGWSQRFDLVLFCGVLYHLRHPQLALDIVARLVDDRLILQTLTMPGQPPQAVPADLPFADRDRLAQPGWPRAAFVEHALAGDPTNWWVADDACVQAMLRSAGLRVLATPLEETYVCAVAEESPRTRADRDRELRAATGGAPGSGASQRK